MGKQNGLYPGNCRSCHRPGEPVEIPLSYGTQRRFSLSCRLSFLYLPFRRPGYDHGDVPGTKNLAAFFILSYYAVIGGWIIKYFISYTFTAQAPTDFNAFIGHPTEPLFWFFLFMLLTGLICYFGVSGIEKASKFMMPALFIILLAIILRGVTMPGASKGLAFIFSPKLGDFDLNSVSAALGQVFYSLSLCMGITITYGSYLSKDVDIPKGCMQIALLDTCMAVLAGIAIFPAVFSCGLEPASGPGLIFVTLPKVALEPQEIRAEPVLCHLPVRHSQLPVLWPLIRNLDFKLQHF